MQRKDAICGGVVNMVHKDPARADFPIHRQFAGDFCGVGIGLAMAVPSVPLKMICTLPSAVLSRIGTRIESAKTPMLQTVAHSSARRIQICFFIKCPSFFVYPGGRGKPPAMSARPPLPNITIEDRVSIHFFAKKSENSDFFVNAAAFRFRSSAT